MITVSYKVDKKDDEAFQKLVIKHNFRYKRASYHLVYVESHNTKGFIAFSEEWSAYLDSKPKVAAKLTLLQKLKNIINEEGGEKKIKGLFVGNKEYTKGDF